MRFGALAMTLAFGLAVVGVASAQESSSWLPRWLAPAADKEKADPDKDDAPKPPPVNRNNARAAKKAKADWERRIDVCDKLRGIALESGDDELLRKVEKLEARIGELYTASRNIAAQSEPPVPEPDAKKGSRK